MSSRTKKMIALALNKELQEKIVKLKSKNTPDRSKKDEDPEYLPCYEGNFGLSSSDSELSDVEKNTEINSRREKNYKGPLQVDENIAKESETDVLKSVDMLEKVTGQVTSEIGLPNNSELSSCDGELNDNMEEELQNKTKHSMSEIEENCEGRVDDDQESETETDVIKSVLSDILGKVTDQVAGEMKKQYTKKGNLRKRKLFEETLVERKKRKIEERVALHDVKLPCNEKCRLKCPTIFDLERQTQINKSFWEMSNTQQRTFVFGCIKRFTKQHKPVANNSRRENSFKYVLKDLYGRENYVCKTFLLATLGFHPANDRFLKSVRNTEATAALPKKDMRGHHPNSSKVDRNLLVEHIKTFRPVISHYRREHAPNRLYLSSDISVTLMHKDFMEKNPKVKVSYELYRQAVASMNISFANLGNEECFECEKFNLHFKSSLHQKEDPNIECEECTSWKQHKENYVAAREEYEKDKKEMEPEKLIISADLQKVILLFF